MNWDDLAWLKDLAKGTPIYLKGVCSAEDVQLAKEHGLAVIIDCALRSHSVAHSLSIVIRV